MRDLPRTRVAFARQTDAVGDDAASLRVYIIVCVLVVIGAALVGLAVWLVRQTRPDRELLAPLERMDERRWRELDPQDRRRSLDEVRPSGAFPIDRAQSEPDVDDDFGASQPVRDFSDLADDGAELAGAAEPDGEHSAAEDERESGASVNNTSAHTGETVAVASDPLVIETELLDPSLLAPKDPIAQSDVPNADARNSAEDEWDEADDPTVPNGRPDDDVPASTDDTGEHPSEAELDVPLMPGEGLLRRPRTDADMS